MSRNLPRLSLLVWLLAIALGHAFELETTDKGNEEKSEVDMQALFINAESSLANLKQHLEDIKQNVAKGQHRNFAASFHSFKEQLAALLNKFELEVSVGGDPTAEPTFETTVETSEETTEETIIGFRDCADIYKNQTFQSGVYTIQPKGSKPFEVYCDMGTEGGGWTVFQRRGHFPEVPEDNFFRDWQDYKEGFGDFDTEFWLGLSKISLMTRPQNGAQELRIELVDFLNEDKLAKYENFQVEGEKADFRLSVGNYNGNAGDALTYHNQQKFSTHDRDNDEHHTANCAVQFSGAWWYRSCLTSCLNGLNLQGAGNKHIGQSGIYWENWKGPGHSLAKTEMKFRPMAWNTKET